MGSLVRSDGAFQRLVAEVAAEIAPQMRAYQRLPSALIPAGTCWWHGREAYVSPYWRAHWAAEAAERAGATVTTSMLVPSASGEALAAALMAVDLDDLVELDGLQTELEGLGQSLAAHYQQVLDAELVVQTRLAL